MPPTQLSSPVRYTCGCGLWSAEYMFPPAPCTRCAVCGTRALPKDAVADADRTPVEHHWITHQKYDPAIRQIRVEQTCVMCGDVIHLDTVRQPTPEKF